MTAELNNPDVRQSILAKRAKGGVQLIAHELAVEFDVSLDTIRRDILSLEALGIVRRVRGGALPVSTPVLPMHQRAKSPSADVHDIAQAAARHIQPGMVLILDGGNTVLEIARHMPDFQDCLVVTPCPLVADAAMNGGKETILLGGKLSPFGGICVGPTVTVGLSNIAADLCFLGACGIDAEFGLGADDFDESQVKRAMAQRANRVIVATSNTKLGKRSRHRVLPPSEVDLIITNEGHEESKRMIAAGFEVQYA
jgi:DeoR/GlpR family transcriptional regulator of sugar metabolism